MEQMARDKKAIISTKQGQDLAKQIGAFGFVECSAKTQKNLKEVVELCYYAVVGTSKLKSNSNNNSNSKCYLQ